MKTLSTTLSLLAAFVLTGFGCSSNSPQTPTSGNCNPDTNCSIGAACNADGTGCPENYTCQSFEGIQVTYSCAILCKEDCECPTGGKCIDKSDKAKSWKECAKP